ncbi:hypothetical protein G7Y79_00017g043740 [Physcia stellaris]|nr:hypothetical protein G7Y79_00017g043740 [Physcia stellaris]
MTPNKSKKPLPSSTSMVIPEPEEPQTSREWKIALQRVKLLYFKNQWKPCLARCNRLLESNHSVSTVLNKYFPLLIKAQLHPLYAAFLHFYAALSNEAIARLTHNLSTTKIPLLEEAKRSYQAASRIMPTLEDPLDEQQKQYHSFDTISEKSSPSSASSTSNTTPRPSPPSSPFYPSSASSAGSITETQPEPQQKPPTLTPSPSISSSLNLSSPNYSLASSSSLTPTTKRRLRPSPLRIPKTPTFNPSTTSIYTTQPTTPPSQIIPSDLNSTPSRPLSVTFSTSSTLWLQNRALDRYHGHLITLANMLIAHIEVVDILIQAAEEAQMNRPKLRRFASSNGGFGALDEEGEETRSRELRASIERGRARGWVRERFDPERYRELCARALGEL